MEDSSEEVEFVIDYMKRRGSGFHEAWSTASTFNEKTGKLEKMDPRG
jgi:hypothetical protein